jgi:hypothetical protein
MDAAGAVAASGGTVGEELAAEVVDGPLPVWLELPQPAAISSATNPIAIRWQTRYTSSPTNLVMVNSPPHARSAVKS